MPRWQSLLGLGVSLLLAGPASAQTMAPVIIPLAEESGGSMLIPVPSESLPPLLMSAGGTVPAETPPLMPAPYCGSLDSLCAPADATVRNRFYANFEFLYWAAQGTHITPMLTTGSGPPGQAGVLDNSNTRVLFGGGRMLDGFRPGMRVEAGYWCDECETLGVSGRFFFLGHEGASLAGGSDGSQVLAMPLILSTPGQIPGPAGYPLPPPFLPPTTVPASLLPPVGVPLQQAVLIGLPNLIRGTVDVNTSTDFIGGSLDVRHMMTHTPDGRIELFGGYRYLFLGDSLNRTFDSAIMGPGGPAGVRFMGNDSWRTRNSFNGPELGMQVTRYRGPFSFTLESSLAMGVTSSTLNVNQTRSLGSLDSQTNIYQLGGTDHSSFFSVVPEVGAKLGWNPTDTIRLTAGYNFIYWSRVRRAQDQYDGTPVTTNRTTDFWAQGWSLGFEMRY